MQCRFENTETVIKQKQDSREQLREERVGARCKFQEPGEEGVRGFPDRLLGKARRMGGAGPKRAGGFRTGQVEGKGIAWAVGWGGQDGGD